MRTIHHYVINKTTRKVIFTHWSEAKCREYFEKLSNKEDFCLSYKWLSI